jgi:hypothetical protein
VGENVRHKLIKWTKKSKSFESHAKEIDQGTVISKYQLKVMFVFKFFGNGTG